MVVQWSYFGGRWSGVVVGRKLSVVSPHFFPQLLSKLSLCRCVVVLLVFLVVGGALSALRLSVCLFVCLSVCSWVGGFLCFGAVVVCVFVERSK